jgi:hypothetical protein
MLNGVLGVTAGVAALIWAGRLLFARLFRKKPPTPQERLVEATGALGGAAAKLGGRAAQRTAKVAQPVAKDAASLARGAATEAAALMIGAGSQAASVAVSAGTDAVELAADGARKVATVAAGGAHEIAEGVERVQRGWRKLVTRLIIVVFGGGGYVLGAKAGRGRYEQIVSAAGQARELAQGAAR